MRMNDPLSQVSLSFLLDEVLSLDVGRKMLLVDACRDVPADPTPDSRNARGIEGRRINLPEGTGVYFSCSAGQMSFEKHELGHGLFTHCVLEALRGEAASATGEISWSRLVAHVDDRMTHPDLIKLMPKQLRQVPIPSGALPQTVLGRVAATTLGKPPAEGEWKELFNGRDLTGWRTADTGQSVTSGWKAADGVLTIVPPSADIRTVDEYSDFELEFDWRAQPGSNSGVKYRVAAATPNSPKTGPEYQLQDDSAFTLVSRAQLSGSIYAVIGPTFDAAQPVSEWNTARITARGNRLEHWLNGQRVVNAEVGNVGWTTALDAWNQSVPIGMRFANDFGQAPTGYIVLTYRNESVSYRRVRIRELPSTTAATPSAPAGRVPAVTPGASTAVAPAPAAGAGPRLTAPFSTQQATAARSAWATRLGVDGLHTSPVGLKLALIPPGEFQMGSQQLPADIVSIARASGVVDAPAAEFDREQPPHRVQISSPYYLGVHEVTQRQWQAVTGTTPSHHAKTGPARPWSPTSIPPTAPSNQSPGTTPWTTATHSAAARACRRTISSAM